MAGLKYRAAGGPPIPISPLVVPLTIPIIIPFVVVGLMVNPFLLRRKMRTIIMNTTASIILRMLWLKEADQKVAATEEIIIGRIIGRRNFQFIFLHIFATTNMVRNRQAIKL